jgi:hypothetical protein
MEILRDNGWLVYVAEKWIAIPGHPAGGVRRDAWSCVDLVAIKLGQPVLFVQTTSADNISHRVEKIRAVTMTIGELEVPVLPVLLDVGRLEIHGWKKPGSASRRWRVRIVDVGTGEDSGLCLPVRPKKAGPQLELAAEVA